MSKQAIIVVDLQNEYLPTGKLPLSGIEDALKNAALVIDFARSNNIPVIHIRHEFTTPGTPFFVPGTDGVLINQEVLPLEDEVVIVKHFPNSFLRTNLKNTLDAKSIDSVTVIGAMSHMCIDATVRAASDFGYETTVVHDACATRDLEFDGKVVAAEDVHTAMMAALEFGYAKITNTKKLLNR